ncbi:S4 domain-containing protein [Porphyromonas sp. COT-239 OH1446]|uniref:S4 domain-containing protein n=1 Tax=Porphyromonas sp. COT-239 OH1446 TaxID=1515613 RepID=UPI00052B7366|nr:S4 domain-containing protein [Porphyromonas sp. COT-239 OH1446]KGN70190.1 hypothetical protein HQ37_03860 [Porphyromonas sp. COT-239 OH1446]
MKLRINKLISDAGLGSRRDVEDYIRQGRVKINGRRAQLSDMVDLGDVVFFDEVDLPVKELLQEHAAMQKQVQKEQRDDARPRPKGRAEERAESQRLQVQSKSAALRKTSKNNPENKRAARLRNEVWDDEHSWDVLPMRHSSKRAQMRRPSSPRGSKGRFRYRDDD